MNSTQFIGYNACITSRDGHYSGDMNGTESHRCVFILEICMTQMCIHPRGMYVTDVYSSQ